MESTLINKAVFYLHTAQHRTGYLGVLGLLMLMLAIGIYFSLNIPQIRHLQKVEIARAQLSASQAQSMKLPIPQQKSRADSFSKQFPDAAHKDVALKTIIAIADKNTLPLATGKYEVLTKESGQLVFYQISFPLKGNFLQIKKFLATTLSALPNAALSQVHLHRTSAESNQVEADVIFTLYFYKPV